MFGGWTQQNPGIMGGVYTGVYFLPGNTRVGYVCGTGLDTSSHMPTGLIIKTTDGGSTWTQQNPNTTNILRAIYFSDANSGCACGVGGTVVRTTDGGTTWNAVYTGYNDQLVYVSFPSSGQTGYIGVNSDTLNARVYKSWDGGASWSMMSVGGAEDRSTNCAMADASNGVAFGIGGFLWGTTDGFATGKLLDTNSTANMMAGAFSRADLNRAYIVGTDTERNVGVIRYASHGSQQDTWDKVRCPLVASFSCVDYASPETAYIGGANGFIGGTKTAHDVWATNTGVTSHINRICFPHGPDTGYAAAGPLILKTTDAGQPWVPGVAEGKSPVTARTGIRVLSNPSRRGISFRADEEAHVTLFDAAGRVVAKQNAAKGMNFLPLSRAGVYMLKATAAGFTTTQKLVVER
jgi:photosystem II stability/assembly factor-like uncharacterized protein